MHIHDSSIDDFLVAVNGVELDAYGQGKNNKYVEELVDYQDLMNALGAAGSLRTGFPSHWNGMLALGFRQSRWR